MRLTFLERAEQVAFEPQRVDRSVWEREFAENSVPIEQALRARLTQIGVGIGFQFTLMRWGVRIVGLSHMDLMDEMLASRTLPLYFAVLLLGVFVLATLVAGAISGAWCINWSMQGVAVGLGYLGTVLAGFLFILPPSAITSLEIPLPVVAVLAAAASITVLLTTLGALLGHLLIRPIRVPRDAVR
jgi:hypothetical protein